MKKLSLLVLVILIVCLPVSALAQPGLPPDPKIYIPAIAGGLATNTPVPPTATATATPPGTVPPLSPTPTATETPIPPTATSTATPTWTPTVTPTNTPIASSFVLLSSYGEQASSTYWVYVELKNVSNTAACYVNLTAKLYRADGSWFIANGQILVYRMLPGQVSSGRLYASTSFSGEVVSHELVNAAWDDCSDYFYYVDVDVVSAHYRYVTYLGTEYYGEVRNSSSLPLSSVRVVTTVYWPSGQIRAAISDSLDGAGGLPAGGYGTFSMQSYHDFTGAPAFVQVQGYGY